MKTEQYRENPARRKSVRLDTSELCLVDGMAPLVVRANAAVPERPLVARLMDLYVQQCREGDSMADIAWVKYLRACIFILSLPRLYPVPLLYLRRTYFPSFSPLRDFRREVLFLFVMFSNIIISFLPPNVNVSFDTSHPPPSLSPSPSLFQKVGAKGKKGGKKNLVKYTIDCNQPVDDKVLDMGTFEKFLKDRIKVC